MSFRGGTSFVGSGHCLGVGHCQQSWGADACGWQGHHSWGHSGRCWGCVHVCFHVHTVGVVVVIDVVVLLLLLLLLL